MIYTEVRTAAYKQAIAPTCHNARQALANKVCASFSSKVENDDLMAPSFLADHSGTVYRAKSSMVSFTRVIIELQHFRRGKAVLKVVSCYPRVEAVRGTL